MPPPLFSHTCCKVSTKCIMRSKYISSTDSSIGGEEDEEEEEEEEAFTHSRDAAALKERESERREENGEREGERERGERGVSRRNRSASFDRARRGVRRHGVSCIDGEAAAHALG